MSTSILPLRQDVAIQRPGPLSNFYRRAVQKRLQSLNWGSLRILEGGRSMSFGDNSQEPIVLRIHSPHFWKEIAIGGAMGAGESYIMGWWTCSDLVGLIRLLCRNRPVMNSIDGGLAWLSKPIHRIAHCIHRNTRSGAARNISAHYDLGNDFFAYMLDPSMMYSAAYYPRLSPPSAMLRSAPVPAVSRQEMAFWRSLQEKRLHPSEGEDLLLEAQIYKMDVLAKKLQLSDQDHLLEIGSGWGAMAIHAARNYGCRVTTTTISQQQYDLACERVSQAGLQDRIEVLFSDYRDLSGRYDKIISIEMIEAIGFRQYPLFFQRCMELLKTNGLALIQAITIADQEYERAKHHVDYIKRYIFPGSCIPSLTALQTAMSSSSDLRILDVEDVTQHYVRTLADWRRRFLHFRKEITAMGMDAYFQRLWEFYLCYCEGGFAERAIGDVHLLMARPGWRPSEAAEAA